MADKKSINTLRHPSYLACEADWQKWRLAYKGGSEFVDQYLQRFSRREDKDDFIIRKALTPIPSHAKAAIKDIRSSIFQRMSEVTRTGGSPEYQAAVKGQGAGVDNRGNSMTSFIGQSILEDLLVIGKVGVYVDAPAAAPPTLLGSKSWKPYLYAYSPEDILSWKRSNPEDPSAFEAVLLRETATDYDEVLGMPCGQVLRHRYIWINPSTGKVNIQFYDADGKEMGSVIKLGLDRIPFVMPDIQSSLMEDICTHQIALLNLWSSNVAYGVQGSFPIYTEQRDNRAGGGHLKQSANPDGTATAGGQGAADAGVEVGVMKGRTYDMEAERPGFINPSAEPLLANLKLCNSLEEQVRTLVNLAVSNLATQASAESKVMDNQGLESGLSFIGLVLESTERQIAYHWAAYEQTVETKRQVATVSYPERWSLKTTAQKIEDATSLHTIAKAIPGQTVKREACKLVVSALLGPKLTQEVVDKIHSEIDSAPYTTSDPEIIKLAKEQGLVGDHTGSVALGFNENEYVEAKADHIDRLKRIAEAQTPPGGGVPGAPDTQGNPGPDNRAAKAAQRDTTTSESTKKPVRGKGKL